MIRRDRFEQLAPQLSTQGFKILLDIVATARAGDPAGEGNSLHFRLAAAWREQARFHGGAGFLRGWCWRSSPTDVVSLRFLLFAMVGSIGLFVHLGTLFI